MTGLRSVAAVGVAALVLVGAGTLLRPTTGAEAPAAPVSEPIASVTTVCPEPGATKDLGVRVTAAVVPGLPGQDRPGTAVLRTLPGPQSASATLTAPGTQAQIQAYGLARPAILGAALGGLAPGFVADQWGRDPAGPGRGLASVACSPAAADQWFVGGAGTVGRSTRLLLVNPEDSPAVVDVRVYGSEGEVDAPGGRGVVVPPRTRVVLRLDALAPGVTHAALHVAASTGRVAAAVSDVEVKGLEPLGSDWIPLAAPPARTVYVPGVSDGPGPRELSVVAPGAVDADVTVKVVTGAGTYTPVGAEEFTVPAGHVVTVDLAKALKGASATVVLTSSVPVAAGLRQRFVRPGELVETSYSAGSLPLTGPAAVTGLPAARGTLTRVSLSAPEGEARVQLALLPYAAGGAPATPTGRLRVTVPAGALVNVDLTAPAGAEWYTAVVTPAEGSAPVLVAHRLIEKGARGLLVTGYPWPPLRVSVEVPAARQDIGVALPR